MPDGMNELNGWNELCLETLYGSQFTCFFFKKGVIVYKVLNIKIFIS